MPFQRGQTLGTADQLERSHIADGSISQSACAVAADTAAVQRVQSEIEVVAVLLIEREASVRADSAAILGRVKGAKSIGPGCRAKTNCGCRNVFAGEHAVAEAAIDTEHFVVAESRLKRQLGDDVGRRIERVVRCRRASGYAGAAGRAVCNSSVVKSATCPCRTHQEVGGVAVSGDGGLRIL